MWVNTSVLSALSAGRQGSCRPVFKNIARLVGRLGLGPRLVADRADVVPTDRVDWPCRPADGTDVALIYTTPFRNSIPVNATD